MAKKLTIMGEESEVHRRAGEAMNVWHRDRLEWSDRALRALILVNAGGAVAVAAFIGRGALPLPLPPVRRFPRVARP